MRHPKTQSRQSIKRARQLRQASTAGEQLLWRILRGRALGPKFRRQHPIGPYVLDFYCRELKLAIELDGTVHDLEEVRRHDDYRETRLRRLGIVFLRLRTEEVIANPWWVEQRIRSEIDKLLPSPPGRGCRAKRGG